MPINYEKILESDKEFIKSAPLRSFPDFIIVGAQKAGTSSIFNQLIQHPQILPPRYKEVHYFDLLYQCGHEFYKGHFPLQQDLKNHNAITGEASPYYLAHPWCAKRINALLPHCKIIISLRNPVERAISHYFMEVNNKHETLDPWTAFNTEEQRISEEYKKLANDPTYISNTFQQFSYTYRGKYLSQIQAYTQLFPDNQVYILKAEDYFKNPKTELKKIYTFLNVDPNFIAQKQIVNQNQKKQPLDQHIYNYLEHYFKPFNQELYDTLNKTLWP